MASKIDIKVLGFLVAILIASTIAISSSLSYSISHQRNVMKSSPGDYSLDFIQDRVFSNIKVEVDYASEKEPAANAIKLLEERIATNCLKNSIELCISDVLHPEDVKSNYTYEDINKLESKYRTFYPSEIMGTISLYILYLNGMYNVQGDKVLGMAYHASSIVIFKDVIKNATPATNPFLDPEDYETAVLIHEFGHLLGLVNIGYQSELNHEDFTPNYPNTTDNPDPKRNHCNNKSCVMYFAIETPGPLQSSLPNNFCSLCCNDLDMLKNKEVKEENLPWIILSICTVVIIASSVAIVVISWVEGRKMKMPAAEQNKVANFPCDNNATR